MENANAAVSRGRVVALTALALGCFAGNSLSCRAALAGGHIDAASFTIVRFVSGALVLVVLARGRERGADGARSERERWKSALALFVYAAPFSFAYLRLGAAIGALVLFGCVQATMIGAGIVAGERPRPLAWLGIAGAVAGLVYLTAPGKSAPDAFGVCAMAVSGVAWGVYSLRGKALRGDPVVATAESFVRGSALAVVGGGAALALAFTNGTFVAPTVRGALLAAASGALASGVGYSLWYAALRHLSATRAAVVQLLVPIVAAALAVAFLGERVTLRLTVASVAIVGGVATTILARERARRPA